MRSHPRGEPRERGDGQVLEHFDVAVFDSLRINLERFEFFGAAHLDGHDAAAKIAILSSIAWWLRYNGIAPVS